MRTFDAAATEALLPFGPLVEALRTACREVAAGGIVVPERLSIRCRGPGTLLSMPCVADDLTVHKLVTVYPGNPALGLPSITGQITALAAATGQPLFSLDGPVVTARRTAAVTLLAIERLLPAAPRRAIVIGTGTQALCHARALAETWPTLELLVSGRSAEKAAAFCARVGAAPGRVHPAAGPLAEAGADCVIAATTSHAPLWDAPARPGVLVIGIGAFLPEMAEIGPTTVAGSDIYVDDPAGARTEAGDLLQAGVDWSRVCSLADAVTSPADLARPLVFKSVGCAAWDLAACRVARTALTKCAEIRPGLRPGPARGQGSP